MRLGFRSLGFGLLGLGRQRRFELSGRFLALVAGLMTTGAAPVVAQTDFWPKTWVSTQLKDHPLVGKIYATGESAFTSPADYLKALEAARFVLLGEVHDNADHHWLQGQAVRHLKPSLRAVAFEHFSLDQQLVIDAFQTGKAWEKSAENDDMVGRFFLVTGWDQSGWPQQALYRPLMEAVLEGDAKILAGNPPRARVRDVARKGIDGLSGDAVRVMLLDRPLGRRAR